MLVNQSFQSIGKEKFGEFTIASTLDNLAE